jgi:hypothetical protein
VAPATVRHLPARVHEAVVDAYALALHPVFLAAAGVSLVAFALTWLVHDTPLRSRPQPHDALPPPREAAAAEAA